MKKVIALSVFALLGSIAGYFVAPFAAGAVVQTSDPTFYWGPILAGYKAEVICVCNNRPPSESAKELSEYLSALKNLRSRSPKSKLLAQEMGLAYIRLSIVEGRLAQKSASDDDMKRGQEELRALGWKDVSESHLVYLVAQLNADSQPANDKKEENNTTVANAK